uniref:NADH dehydrogenase subunit 2 n=1 Tax=Lauridromia dehaani TaxID=516916 RepID=UPI0021CCD402|nr:NADH dehydrogenase subunit 2 [Lauridromia dehaani]UWM10778.1 NADH dehydrogenase subunit 2 [Lauridromia dehaani]
MLFSPIFLPYLMILILGSVLSISSSSWFGAWVGLELNLMSFIPLISTKLSSSSSEAALKYFLTQALGSSIIIFSSSIMFSFSNLSLPLILMAILLKLGSAPFHFWFPQVMNGLLWPQIIILATIQKLAPMFLISYLLNNPLIENMILLSAILSALIGALGGVNQMNLRKIMAYSSINHMAWMLTAISISENLWILYFIFYSFISSSVILLFNSIKAYHFSNMFSNLNHSSFLIILTPMTLLSLGGLPPFSGFIPKWLLIQMLINENLFFMLFFLLLSALVTLFFYLRIFIIFLILLNPSFKWSHKSPYFKNHFTSFLIFGNMFGLLLPTLFMTF